MRLKSIKLAGFKSFVDPTTVNFPSNMCAVVGPNGCGKSNVIDAVRWVMGESSAKNLRGESMADVIFNGSVNRQPVGQASIELVFDNTEGRIGGEYASYAEISTRRQVSIQVVKDYPATGPVIFSGAGGSINTCTNRNSLIARYSLTASDLDTMG